MDAGADAEIRSLLARVAQLADDGTVEAYLELFTDDAVWEMPANQAVGAPADRRAGRAAIGAGVRARRAAGMQGPGTATRHVVTGTAVLPAAPAATAAAAVSYWMFLADTTSAPRLVSIGRYDDELCQVGGRWLLARRTITVG
jgi:3-phenylpropionate/cinnamic acid dioxygenase small subunit